MDQQSLFEGSREAGFVPLSSLTGIARLAADAPVLDARNEVEYRALPCRTLIAGCASRRVPFEYQINPYRGCEIGCTYCYARYTHEFMDLGDWLEFERKVFVKQGAREALLSDLRRLDLRGKHIAIGTATDPYQPAERRFRVTRSLLEVFAEWSGLSFSITTKTDLVVRDVDLLRRIAERNAVNVNVTITTPHRQLARRVEPRAPRPDKRLAAVARLAAAGVRVGVFAMPLLPHITDGAEDVELLCRLAREAGAESLVAQHLFLRQCSKKRFFPFLAEEFPELLPTYRRLYGSYHTEALDAYKRAKMAEITQIVRRYDLAGRRSPRPERTVHAEQLTFAELDGERRLEPTGSFDSQHRGHGEH